MPYDDHSYCDDVFEHDHGNEDGNFHCRDCWCKPTDDPACRGHHDSKPK